MLAIVVFGVATGWLGGTLGAWLRLSGGEVAGFLVGFTLGLVLLVKSLKTGGGSHPQNREITKREITKLDDPDSKS
jgi:hypothetical protein